MFTPLNLLGPPVLLLISIPLAALAAVTTSLAFTTLFVRVSVVYFELARALLHSWLFVEDSSPDPAARREASFPPRWASQSSRRTRLFSRRSSVVGDSPRQRDGDTTSLSNPGGKSGSFVSLIGEPDRDFEGIGGWRVPGSGDEEAVWIGMNSRLELPATGTNAAESNASSEIYQEQRRRRHHRRSLTAGSNSAAGGFTSSSNQSNHQGQGRRNQAHPAQQRSWSPEAVYMRMSPVQTNNSSRISVATSSASIRPVSTASSSSTSSSATIAGSSLPSRSNSVAQNASTDGVSPTQQMSQSPQLVQRRSSRSSASYDQYSRRRSLGAIFSNAVGSMSGR